MNRRQRACIKVGFLLLILATLFPPWTYSYRSRYSTSSSSSYGFLFHPPFGGAKVNLAQLFVEWVLIALVTSGLFLTLGKRPIVTTEKQPHPLAAAGSSAMKGGRYCKLNYPGLARDFIAHVDEHERVTVWEDGQPATTGLTRDQLQTYGVEFKTATEDAITRHTNLERPKTYRAGKLLKRKFIIPFMAAFAFCVIGLVYYGSKRIVTSLPPTEVSKLAGIPSISGYRGFVWDAYNGSDFVLTEVRVSISVFDEKGNAVISNRVYRLPAYDFYPQQTKELSTDIGFSLEQGQTWQFSIVGAKGRPE